MLATKTRMAVRPYKRKILLSTIALTFIVSATLASAQVLEEVVVTAQKREQNVNDIGMAISTFTGTDLQDLGVFETRDLAAFTPGFHFEESNRGVPVYTLRGVGNTSSAPVATSTVAIYVDEFVIPYPMMTRGVLLDIERVEVLKGPQGTLYGRNTTGGAINYISVKPEEEFEAAVRASYSSFQTVDFEGYVNLPFGDNVRSRLAVKTQQSGEGWQRNGVTGEELGEKDSSALRFSLAAELSDKLSALLQVNWWENNSDTQAAQFVESAYEDLDNTPVIDVLAPSHAAALLSLRDARSAGFPSGRDFSFDQDFLSFNLSLKYDINDSMDIISLTGYTEFRDDGSNFGRGGVSGVSYDDAAPFLTYIVDGVPTPFPGVDPSLPVASTEQDRIGSVDFFSQEFRLLGATDNVEWVSGLYYSKDDNDNQVSTELPLTTNTNNLGGLPFLSFSGIGVFANTESESLGAYVHSTWEFREDLRLTTGLRYSDDEIIYAGCTRDPGDGSLETLFTLAGLMVSAEGFVDGCGTILTDEQGLPLGHGVVHDKLNEDSVSFKLGLDWFVTDDALLYGSYSRGYKSGGFTMTAANVDIQLEPTTQEQLDALEFGVKSTLLDGAMQLNASVYYYDYEDKQLSGTVLTVFGPLGRLENVGDSTVRGAEVDLQWQPLEGLTLMLAGAYVDSEIEEYSAKDVFGEDQVFDGSEFPNTPKFQASARLDYNWSIAGNLNMFVGVDANYTDSVNTDFVPEGGSLPSTLIIDSYTLANARIGVRDGSGRWSVMLWSRNLTDEVYETSVRQFSEAFIAYMGMPRTYGLTVDYHF